MRGRFGLVAMLATCVACGGSHPSPDTVPSEDAGADAAPEAATAIFEYISQPQQPDDLVLWLRADTGVTLAADGTVAGWSDLSGLGNRNAGPLAGTPGLLFVPNEYNGQPAVRGDGTARNMFVNAGHGYPMGHASTVFMVMTGSTAGTVGLTIDVWSTGGRQYTIVETDAGVAWSSETTATALGDASVAASAKDTFPFTKGAPPGGLHVYAEAQTDGVEGSGYFDGCKVASFVPAAPSLYIESLMGGPGNGIDGVDPMGVPVSWGTFESNGDLVEVLQYDVELTEPEIAGVNTYLARRYALPEGAACSPSYQ
jgi:hypothetical protein